MAFSNSAYFFTGNGFAHDGNIRCISSESGEPTSGPYEIYVSVYYGTGDEVLHESTETGTGEITYNAGGNGGYNVPIPKNADGTYKSGRYKVKFVAYDTDTSAVVDTQVSTVEYTPNVKDGETITADLDFTAEYDCITGLITATDSTPMAGWQDNVEGDWRVISVVPPPTPEEPDPAPLTDESDDLEYESVTFSFAYTNATYQVALSIFRSKTLEGATLEGLAISFVQTERIGKVITLNIQCDTTLCDVAACVEDEFTLLETAACGGGGWGNLTARQKAKFDYVVAMDTVRQLYAAPGCQNIAKAAEYAEKIKTFLDCGCGCGDTDQPTPYTAPGA